MQLFLVVVLVGLALLPLAAVLGRVKVGDRTTVRAIVAIWVGLAVLFGAALALGTRQPADGERAITHRPIQVPTEEYVGSDACRSCHPHNHSTWHDSYHRTMTQVASEESVLGNFDNVQLLGKDLTVRLFRRGKQFRAEMRLHNPSFTGNYPVVLTTGSHTRQAYWLGSSSDPRLMLLPYMFLKAEKKWIPRHSGYISTNSLQERPELHVLEINLGRWSEICIRCHTTHGRPHPGKGSEVPVRYPSESQVAEFGISCEACHGPGAAHVRVNGNPLRRYRQRLGAELDSTIVNPARLPHHRSSQVCGQCHSVFLHRSVEAQTKWAHEGYPYRPGEDLARDFVRFIMPSRSELLPHDYPRDYPRPAEMDSFWPDGMIRATGREYNGLIESPCYLRGTMSCMSCHQMHQPVGEPRKRQDWADDQLKIGMDGNAACLQCHDQFRHADRLTQHTHHAADSVGSNCYNCHMPFTTYGLLKAVRSHQIDSPSVSASLATGRPNACNQCHQDRTLAWTADHLARWYAIARPKLSRDEEQIAATVLWALRGDAGQRALMAWSFGWEDAQAAAGNHWQAPYLAQLLEDRYDAVRLIAHRSLRRLPAFHDFEYDFDGSLEHRATAHQRALQVWSRSPQARKRPFARAVLLDQQGRLLETDFQRLWKQRDDRPMNIAE